MNAWRLTFRPWASHMNACWRKRKSPPASWLPCTITSAASFSSTCTSWLVVKTAWSAAIFALDRAADVREPVHVSGRRRLLDPVEVVPLEPSDPVDGRRAVPRLVRVDPKQRLGADRLAHRRDARVVVARSAADLEVDDAVALAREPTRMRRELLRLVSLQEAEVVDLLVHRAAEERPRGDSERAAQRVPAGDLEPGHEHVRELREHLPATLGPDRAQDRLDVARRAAHELARDQLAVGRDGALVLADRLPVARRLPRRCGR